MADYDSGLPVRSEADGLDERLHIKIVDGTNPAVNQATVDSDKNLKVSPYGNRADDAADVALNLSEEGKPNGRGDYEVDDNSEPASTGLVAGIRSTNNTRVEQTEHITSKENAAGNIRSLDVSLLDENAEPFSQTNPLPVTLSQSEGDEIHDYDKAVAIVKDATSNHDYSVASGDIFLLKQVLTSASGKMKIEVQIGDGGAVEVFTSKFVRFNSTAHPEADVSLTTPIVVTGTANTTTIRIIRTNLDNQPQDLYSTIVGVTQT